jgi:hypothetical protein
MSTLESGDRVVKRSDRGIPGLTLKVFSVSGDPYDQHGQTMVALNDGRQYTTAYPADQLMVLTPERTAELTAWHAKLAADYRASQGEA